VLTVDSYRPSKPSQAALESNYGHSGGAFIVSSAHAQREREDQRRRNGQAKMYFLPVDLEEGSLTVFLPSTGRSSPRQRWIRVE